MIVYLRDIADYKLVNKLYEERFPDKPRVIVHAPVCRSGWLVEMECMAVKAMNDKKLPSF
jgi:enamine deaminase RidA (YjgF/YER057c/UK114 family)